MIPNDELRVELLRRPPGGQQVGDGVIGIRVTHIPSGLIAEVRGHRSQHRSRQIAVDMIEGGLTSPHYMW